MKESKVKKSKAKENKEERRGGMKLIKHTNKQFI